MEIFIILAILGAIIFLGITQLKKNNGIKAKNTTHGGGSPKPSDKPTNKEDFKI